MNNMNRIEREKIICIDTETTGFSPCNDEILQLSIINGCGEVLFNEHFRPQFKTEWPHAQAVHGISPEMLQDKNPIKVYIEQIQEIMLKADLCIGYNASFDLNFLHAAGVTIPNQMETYDVMWAFSKMTGKRKSLSSCADFLGYSFQAHDSLEDVKATLHCYLAMNNLHDAS